MECKYLNDLDAGLNFKTLKLEASRCLLCLDAPCSKECPAGTDPAKFIRSVRFDNLKGAAETIRENNPLGGICARVCPTEKYCQKGCLRCGIDKPIDIGAIQRYVCDFEQKTNMKILKKGVDNNKRIAIVGSGPSGLSLASLLLQHGYSVDLYEKNDKLGGYLRYGIPSYRLSNEVLDNEINKIIDLGLKYHTNTEIGKDITLNELKTYFDAVVVAIGYSKGKILDMFKDNPYVESAVDFLKRIKENDGHVLVDDNVLVIGGGDVSMDICTSLKILGSTNVSAVVYEELFEFKASKKELEDARKHNVTIIDGYVPVACKDNHVTFKHRRLPYQLEMTADKIVLAVGQTYDLGNIDLEMDKGQVKTKYNYQVGDSNVFVIGDISINKEKTVVGSVKSAKEALYYINKYLGGF